MRVVLIHFHLNTGGVTTVVRQQAEALMACGHGVLLLSGEAPKTGWPVPVCVVPGLAYDTSAQQGADSAIETADEILAAMHRMWPGKHPDLIHVHNPTLAKNRRLQTVLKRLQRVGLMLLCQIHDFAEDGRPNVYFEETYLADCHYVVVNGRDRQILLRSGLQEQGVHHLPNAIQPLTIARARPDALNGAVLYPVRAIRRKNIGEAILLQVCAFPSTSLIVTLPPTSASDMPGYDMWRRYANKHRLPVTFEAGLRYDFKQLMTGCRYVLTTSINEGFGFSFLEAWTIGKALWGRLLPDICQDFIQRGIRLDHLYPRLWIPVTWIDGDSFRRLWQTVRKLAVQRFGQTTHAERLETDWKEIAGKGLIDYGLLSEPFQRAVLDRLIADRAASRHLLKLNPALKRLGSEVPVAENRRAVLDHFSPAAYARRLMTLYEKVLTCPVRQQIDKAALFSAFMTPDRFSLLKWSGFDE